MTWRMSLWSFYVCNSEKKENEQKEIMLLIGLPSIWNEHSSRIFVSKTNLNSVLSLYPLLFCPSLYYYTYSFLLFQDDKMYDSKNSNI